MASSDEALLGPRISSAPAARPNSSVVLKGDYVTLEGITRDHIPSLHNNLRLWENAHLMDYLPLDVAQLESTLWEQVDDMTRNRDFIIYAIRADPKHVNPGPQPQSNEHTETVGIIAYLNVVPVHRTIEIGAVLFSPVLARSTAATEAHYLLLQNVLEENSPGLGGDSPAYRRVEWKCNHLNKKSRRAAERLGYVFEGTFRNHWVVKGRSRDSDWLSIIDSDWPAVKAALQRWLLGDNFDDAGKQIRDLDDIRAAITK